MRQTNNTIKFLMSQYRAIYKKAFILGLAGTASFAVGMGSAGATNLTQDTNDFNDKKDIEITGLDSSNGAGSYKFIQITSDGSVLNDKNLTILDGAFENNYIRGDIEDVKVESIGNLIVDTDRIDFTGLTIGGGTKDTDVSFKNVTIRDSTVVVQGGPASGVSSNLNVTDTLSIDGGTLNVIASDSSSASLVASSLDLGAGVVRVQGVDASAVFNKDVVIDEVNADLYMDGGTVQLKNGLTLKNGDFTILGGAVREANATISGSALTMTGGALSIKGGEIGTNGGNAKLTIQNGASITNGVVSLSETDGGTATLVIEGNATNTSDVVISGTNTEFINSDGIVNVINGTLTFEDSLNPSNISNTGTITLGNGSNGGTLKASKEIFDKLLSENNSVLALNGGNNVNSSALLEVTNTNTNNRLDLSNYFNSYTGELLDTTDAKKGILTVGANTFNTISSDYMQLDSAKFDVSNLNLETNDLKLLGDKGVFTVVKGNLDIANTLDITSAAENNGILAVSGVGSVDFTGEMAANGGDFAVELQTGADNTQAVNVIGTGWSFDSVKVADSVTGKVNIGDGTNKADLTISNTIGTGIDKGNTEGVIVVKNNATLDLGTSISVTSSGTLADESLSAANSIKFDGGLVIVNISDSGSLSTESVQTLLDALKSSDSSKATISQLQIQGATLSEDADKIIVAGTGSWEDIKAATAGVNVDNFKEVNATVNATDASTANLYGTLGAVTATNVANIDNPVTISVQDDTVLTLAKAADGYLVSATNEAGTKKEANLALGTNGGTINLNGDGKLGDITISGDGQGIVNINADVEAGNLGNSSNALEAVVIGTANSSSFASVYTNNFSSINEGANISIDNLNIKDNGTATIGGNVKVGSLVLGGTNAKSYVGADGNTGYTSTFIAKSASFNGGTFVVDPDFSKDAAFAVFNDLANISNQTGSGEDFNVLNGKIGVGKNSVVAIGFTDKDSVVNALGDYLVNGKLTDYVNNTTNEGISAALVLNRGIEVASGNGILIDASKDQNTLATTVLGDAVIFGQATSALVLTDEAFGSNKSEPAIKFNSNNGTVTATTGGKILLSGNFSEANKNLTIFEGLSNSSSADIAKLELSSVNGLLSGTLSTDGSITNLTYDTTAANIKFANISAPVRDLLVLAGKGEFANLSGLGIDFVADVNNSSQNGLEIDRVSHFATYSGVQQTSLAAVQSSVDAISARQNIAYPQTRLVYANNTNGAGLWFAPIYKSVDSDGFDSQGASYGADISLGGAALGADFTTENGIKVGAMFNIGFGSADGMGNGAGLSNDFDYYGLGLYAGMGINNFSVTADINLTQVSNDIDGESGVNGFGKLNADVDTTAVSFGITGQYLFATSSVDVAPHIGVRYTRLDTDSYDVNSTQGVIATTDSSAQDIISIPVGVTFSKDIVLSNGFTIMPVADINVTFNTGDTDLDSNTQFTGINRTVGLTSEVLDSVTYGATLGVNAKSGNLGLGLNVNYTGSTNTDELSIGANVQYMF